MISYLPGMLMGVLVAASMVSVAQTPVANDSAKGEDIVLHGDISPAKSFKHEMLEFTVPEGIQRILALAVQQA
jgi:hypothetical protein